MAGHRPDLHSVVDLQVSAAPHQDSEQISRLNREQNAMAPVYRLPPELLSRIFFESVFTTQPFKRTSHLNPHARITPISGDGFHRDQYPFVPWQEGHIPDILPLCRVSHYWRCVALGSPELWAHIQVSQDTKSELLEFARSNAREVPLDLDLHIRCLTWNAFEHRDVLSDILLGEAGRLKSLSICCNSQGVFTHLQSDLLQVISTPADQLESLEIGVGVNNRTNLVDLFPSGTPNLRSLEIRGVAVPWTSAMLKSFHLTYLILHSLPEFNTSTFSEFLTFLRHVTQLTTLHMDIPRQPSLTWSDVGGKPTERLHIPCITTLQLVSRYFAPLSLVMEAVKAPEVVAVKIFCGHHQPSRSQLEAICRFVDPDEPPEQVEFHFQQAGSTTGFVVSSGSEDVSFDGGRVEMWARDLPRVIINTGIRGFPFPPINSSLHRVPWSFARLRVITVGEMLYARIPQEFWEELAELPTLEIIHMKWARMRLIQGFLRAMLVSEKRHGTQPASITTHNGREAIAVPVSHPFAALRAIVFESLEEVVVPYREDLEILYHSVPSLFKLDPALWNSAPTHQYLECVAFHLGCWRDYGRRRLDELRFRGHGLECGLRGCRDNRGDPKLEETDEELIGRLLHVANRVDLDGRLYRTIGDREILESHG